MRRVLAFAVLAAATSATGVAGCSSAEAPAPSEAPPPAAESGAPEPTASDAGARKPDVKVSLHRASAAEGRLAFGAHFEIEEGWHIYWKNPGDAGLPTTMKVEGAEALELGYLPPERFTSPGEIESFGYEHATWLFAEMPAPAAGPLTVQVSWLACADSCVKQKAELKLELDAPIDPKIELLRARVPTPLPEAGMSYSWQGDKLELRFDERAVKDFFPYAVDPMIFERFEIDDRTLRASWRRGGALTPAGPQGVVVLEGGQGPQAFELAVPWPPQP